MNSNITLDNLTDKQKIWLSQISYLELSSTGREKIASGGIKVSELINYLADEDKPFNGNASMGDEIFKELGSRVLGMESYPTQKEVVDELIDCGLGDLIITDISKEQSFLSSGFQALAFIDGEGNRGISYRGSDFDFTKGGVRDWLESDMIEYFTNDSTQRKEALEFFEKNKDLAGNNYVYGHSLGGNLTSHVYLENHDSIMQAFTINGNPINQKLLDTPEKIAAFNDPNKYDCNVISGDIVGHFKSTSKYSDNVKYIKPNGELNKTALAAHTVQAAAFDENGNLIEVTEKEMIKEMGFTLTALMSFIKLVREVMNEIEQNLDEKFRTPFEIYEATLNNLFIEKVERLEMSELELDREELLDRKAEIAKMQQIMRELQERNQMLQTTIPAESSDFTM